ncbi:MAG: Holliday junction branch migration protein RuvA [Acidobacteria bacterium]|nr:Holliday junction branch migration protein RuvA [Acidobacteriota bacterium]
MIGSLRGRVLERISDSTALLEVAGVGYVVYVTPRTLAELEPTTEAFLHVHHHVREDAQMLFGFLERDERRTFQVLIETNGIGPTLAMAILATHSPRALVDIVLGGDVAGLTMVPGVGKKTAERLLLELKDRLNLPVIDEPRPAGERGGGLSNVRDALAGLGYDENEIRVVLREISVDDDPALMLREALGLLGARRA